MEQPETLSPLAELGQVIYERACEARRKAAIHHENKNYHGAVAYTRVASALVELGNEVDRMMAKAEKASVGQTFNGGSLQRVGRLCALWREEAAQMDQIAKEEGDDESKMAVECRERSLALRDCADALQREWEGTEPNVQAETPKVGSSA